MNPALQKDIYTGQDFTPINSSVYSQKAKKQQGGCAAPSLLDNFR
jgi:hypothetical protein